VKDVNVGVVRKMILGWVLVWILGGGVALGFLGFVVKEWIWKPLMLIELCKRQGITGFPFVPFVGQMPAIDEVCIPSNFNARFSVHSGLFFLIPRGPKLLRHNRV